MPRAVPGVVQMCLWRGAEAVQRRCRGGAEAVQRRCVASRVTSAPLIAAPCAATVCAQVLPPGTRPLVSLARSILGGQLDERLLGSSGDGAT